MEDRATYETGGSRAAGPLLDKPNCGKCGRKAHEGTRFSDAGYGFGCDGYEPMMGDDDATTEHIGACAPSCAGCPCRCHLARGAADVGSGGGEQRALGSTIALDERLSELEDTIIKATSQVMEIRRLLVDDVEREWVAAYYAARPMSTDTWTRMLMASCRGCQKYRGCDTYRTVTICEACWRNRTAIAAKAGAR